MPVESIPFQRATNSASDLRRSSIDRRDQSGAQPAGRSIRVMSSPEIGCVRARQAQKSRPRF